jgi:hypothetical protein
MATEEFLSQIKASNDLLRVDAPQALFLIAEEDWNGAFSGLRGQYLIAEVAKTHKVAIEIINDGSQLIEKARKVAEEKPISLLVVMAHGTPNSMLFGKMGEPATSFTEKELQKLREEELKELDSKVFAPNATIILASCKTGQGLAQEIANSFNRTVLAPIENLTSSRALFTLSDNGEPLLFHQKTGREQIVYKYKKGAPRECVSLSEERVKKVSSQKLDYYKKCAVGGRASDQFEVATLVSAIGEPIYGRLVDEESIHWALAAALPEGGNGDSEAKLLIGLFYQDGRGGLLRSLEKGLVWFIKSASQGNARAQYAAGHCYEKGLGCKVSYAHALYWYIKAADQGFADAKISIKRILDSGILWSLQDKEEQQGALSQIIEGLIRQHQKGEYRPWDLEIRNWFSQSALNGHSQAEFCVGYLFEFGVAFQQSYKWAHYWYQKATEQGHADAGNSVNRILDSGVLIPV